MTASATQVELDTNHPPFDLLPEQARAELRAAVDLHFVPKGARLLDAGQPSPRVYVILKGRVQASEIRDGQEQSFADYGPGDLLGAFAVIMGKARYSYVALEDTLCHAVAAARFQQLVEAHPRFAAWFHAGLSAKRKLLAESAAPAELGRLMLTRAGDAQLAPALFVVPASSLAECVRMMKSRHVSCLLVGDRADRVAHVLEDPLSELHQALGCRRHANLPANPQEQRFAQFLLENRDLAADRRLREAQVVGGVAEAQVARHRLDRREARLQ